MYSARCGAGKLPSKHNRQCKYSRCCKHNKHYKCYTMYINTSPQTLHPKQYSPNTPNTTPQTIHPEHPHTTPQNNTPKTIHPKQHSQDTHTLHPIHYPETIHPNNTPTHYTPYTTTKQYIHALHPVTVLGWNLAARYL